MVVLRIILESYDHFLLENISIILITQARDFSQKIKGSVHLPTRLRQYCILTSPHINKKAREHFEIRKYKRIFGIDEKGLIELLNTPIPSGVGIRIAKLPVYEKPPSLIYISY